MSSGPFAQPFGTSVYLNLGGGDFGPATLYPTVSAFPLPEAADFNGDGLLDVPIQTLQSPREHFYLPNNGAGGFDAAVSMGMAPSNSIDFYAFDQDDDGDIDAIVEGRLFGDPEQNQLQWLENLGGSFAPAAPLPGTGPSGDANGSPDVVGFLDLDEDGDRDAILFERKDNDRFLLWRSNERSLGGGYCDAVQNSTGVGAACSVAGTRDVAANRLTLLASDLPEGSAGIFIAAPNQGFAAQPGGSLGNVCLSGSVSRYARPGEVRFSDAAGRFALEVDLTNTPTPLGAISILAGETWNYQAWYRDLHMGATSNFTSGYSVTFR